MVFNGSFVVADESLVVGLTGGGLGLYLAVMVIDLSFVFNGANPKFFVLELALISQNSALLIIHEVKFESDLILLEN